MCLCIESTESRHHPTTNARIQPPTWPKEKHLTLRELFHFAACARRIGKLATIKRRKSKSSTRAPADEEHGLELTIEGAPHTASVTSPTSIAGSMGNSIVDSWRILSSADGLCGSTLGMVVKNGYDWTSTWLACTLTFGGQSVVRAAEKRLGPVHSADFVISPVDFDSRPADYEDDESDMMMHPKPILEVVAALKSLLDDGNYSRH